jgi:MFS family permease
MYRNISGIVLHPGVQPQRIRPNPRVSTVRAWSYGALLACRLLTGVGAAMIPPNSMAIIADHFPPDRRGTPMSIVLCASFFGMVLVVPLRALLVDLGGWRLPFWVMSLMIAIVWGLQQGDRILRGSRYYRQ